MATKLKNLQLTSVDLVRAGANQEADILLYKSAEGPVEGADVQQEQTPEQEPDNAPVADSDAEDPIEKDYTTFDTLNAGRENDEKLWRYTDALTTSIRSIKEDNSLDAGRKLDLMRKSLGEFDTAMADLFSSLCGCLKDTPKAKQAEPKRYDRIVEVEKFNPYHDSRGRFASSNSYASFTIRTKDPKKQHMADMAVAREKQRNAAATLVQPGNPHGDPATIGGAPRGNPMTQDEANQQRANPNFEKSNGYRINCASCVVTYEARLRGYDVQTQSNTKSNQSTQHLMYNTDHAWIDPKTGKPPVGIRNDVNAVKNAKQARQWMEDTIQPGERYTFRHGWKGRGRSGHIISADRDTDGSLRLYDPQNGKTYKGADVDKYLGKTKAVSTSYGTKYPDMWLTRVDNMRINPAYADGIMEAVNHG